VRDVARVLVDVGERLGQLLVSEGLKFASIRAMQHALELDPRSDR
jgi:hypothetical protein